MGEQKEAVGGPPVADGGAADVYGVVFTMRMGRSDDRERTADDKGGTAVGGVCSERTGDGGHGHRNRMQRRRQTGRRSGTLSRTVQENTRRRTSSETPKSIILHTHAPGSRARGPFLRTVAASSSSSSSST